jgi:hypothetical protein
MRGLGGGLVLTRGSPLTLGRISRSLVLWFFTRVTSPAPIDPPRSKHDTSKCVDTSSSQHPVLISPQAGAAAELLCKSVLIGRWWSVRRFSPDQGTIGFYRHSRQRLHPAACFPLRLALALVAFDCRWARRRPKECPRALCAPDSRRQTCFFEATGFFLLRHGPSRLAHSRPKPQYQLSTTNRIDSISKPTTHCFPSPAVKMADDQLRNQGASGDPPLQPNPRGGNWGGTWHLRRAGPPSKEHPLTSSTSRCSDPPCRPRRRPTALPDRCKDAIAPQQEAPALTNTKVAVRRGAVATTTWSCRRTR